MNVFLIAAMTADGFIAKTSDQLADWTSKEDKQLFVKLTKEAGVMVMGSRTFATIGRALPGRRTIVYTSQPEKISIEGVKTTNEPPTQLVERLKNEGVPALAICGGATVYDLFLRAGVVDELYLTIEPLLFGKGVPLLNDTLDVNLSLLKTEKLNENTILLHYRVKK